MGYKLADKKAHSPARAEEEVKHCMLVDLIMCVKNWFTSSKLVFTATLFSHSKSDHMDLN